MSGIRTSTLLCQLRALVDLAIQSDSDGQIDILTIWEALDKAKADVEGELRRRQLFAEWP